VQGMSEVQTGTGLWCRTVCYAVVQGCMLCCGAGHVKGVEQFDSVGDTPHSYERTVAMFTGSTEQQRIQSQWT